MNFEKTQIKSIDFNKRKKYRFQTKKPESIEIEENRHKNEKSQKLIEKEKPQDYSTNYNLPSVWQKPKMHIYSSKMKRN